MVSNCAYAIAAWSRIGRSSRPRKATRSAIAAGTSSASGATCTASRGPCPLRPTHTSCSRRCPASEEGRSSSACMARTAARSSRSASPSAASMVRTFATTARAFALRDSSSSARASWRAPTVSSSIREEEADSVRSRIALIGPSAGCSLPTRARACASNAVSACSASATSAARSPGRTRSSRPAPARRAGSVASQGPDPRARAEREASTSSGTIQCPGRRPTGGTDSGARTALTTPMQYHFRQEVLLRHGPAHGSRRARPCPDRRARGVGQASSVASASASSRWTSCSAITGSSFTKIGVGLTTVCPTVTGWCSQAGTAV